MFTGIVEEIGTIISVKKGPASAVLTIGANKVIDNTTKIGDSISLNGVCLTVTSLSENTYTVDVMNETLKRSNLGELKSKDRVNLERAMPADGRFGGHIVSGHIDGQGSIADIRKDDTAIWYTIQTTPKLLRYIVEKGSIAIDGISLTVATVEDDSFSVSLIPHTQSETILQYKKTGDMVNLETDIIAKYIEKLCCFSDSEPQKQIDMNFLAENGFL